MTDNVYDPVKAKQQIAELMKKLSSSDREKLNRVKAEEKAYTEKLRRKNG